MSRHLGGRAQRPRRFLVLYLFTHAPDYPPSQKPLAWVVGVNPARGRKLRALFNRINWAA